MNQSNQSHTGADLLRIHAAITRGVSVAQENVAAFSGSEALPNGLRLYVETLLNVMHAHHEDEDEVAWPYLRERMPDAPYDALIGQHRAIADVIQATRAALEAGDLAALSEQLTQLQAHWLQHQTDEENAFSPQTLSAALSPDEDVELANAIAHYAEEYSTPAPLNIPFILYNLRPAQREIVIREMPAEVSEHLVPQVWREVWEPMQPYLLP